MDVKKGPVGLMWLEESGEMEKGILAAQLRYAQRFGQAPTRALVNAGAIVKQPPLGIEVVAVAYILPKHVLVMEANHGEDE